jgi:hypothetical protein
MLDDTQCGDRSVKSPLPNLLQRTHEIHDDQILYRFGNELYSKVVDEGSSGVSWVMVQITLPMKKEWIRHARTYYDSLSASTAQR